MAEIEIKDLDIIFGKEKKRALRALKSGKSKAEILDATGCTVAVQNADISVKEGEFFVVMGLSGSGKSTLLRAINRLNTPINGEVLVNGEDVLKASEKRLLEIRREEFAMVFQHFGLLPHRTVIDNIGFGLEIRGMDKNKRHEIARDTMKLVGLEGYGSQMVSELSGGMQQRVGLARAFANDPGVLLMDEAFSALDPLIRNEMQDELISLQKKMKKTIIFITHDLDEAIKLGDRIAIMRDGAIVQIGTSEEILTNPANDYVKDFVESVDRSNIVTAESIMYKNPVLVRHPADGPAVVLRRMREKGLPSLPVVNEQEELIGRVGIEEISELRKQEKNSIEPALKNDILSVGPSAVLRDLLPLLTQTNLPICVINDSKKLKGVISLNRLIIETTGKKENEIDELIENSVKA